MPHTDLRARIVALGGDIDFSSTPMLTRLCASFSSYDVIVLDLRHVDFADTTFLRFLLQLKKRARPEVPDPVRLVAMTKRPRRLLEVTGLASAFAFFDRQEDAVRDASIVDEFPMLLVS